MIELRGRLVVPGTPCLPTVYRNGRALIHRQSDDLRILRINPNVVIVVSSRRSLNSGKAQAAIGGTISGNISDVDPIFVLWIDPYAGKIVATPP